MSVRVEITLRDGPLGPASPLVVNGGGAVLTFDGVVRPTEAGRPLAALRYEAYEPMTSRQLRALAETVADQHGLLAIRVEHSVGVVPAGAVSFRLSVVSRHRKEGIAALDAFIDTMKRDVALWKSPVFVEDGVRA